MRKKYLYATIPHSKNSQTTSNLIFEAECQSYYPRASVSQPKNPEKTAVKPNKKALLKDKIYAAISELQSQKNKKAFKFPKLNFETFSKAFVVISIIGLIIFTVAFINIVVNRNNIFADLFKSIISTELFTVENQTVQFDYSNLLTTASSLWNIKDKTSDTENLLSDEVYSLLEYGEAITENTESGLWIKIEHNDITGIRGTPTKYKPGTQEVPNGQKPIQAITVSANAENYAKFSGVTFKNETDYAIDLNVSLENLPDIKISNEGTKPLILIVHTHATESFTPSGVVSYDPKSSDSRTLDTKKNVVRVGEELANALTKKGIAVIHDKTLHDYPSYNGSYKSTLKTVESYLKKYPSIKFVLDIHRDSMINNEGVNYKVIKQVNGKNAAQIMIVTGTNFGGLTHDNWKENFRFSVALQRAMEAKYKGIMRPIDLRSSRFNQHTTYGSVIFEMGSSANTLDETIYSAQLLANGLYSVIQELKGNT